MVNGKDVNYFPEKADFTNVNVECDNEADGTWDMDKWGIIVTNLKQSPTVCKVDFIFESGATIEYNYTGNEQTFIVPVNGTYKLEVWGAQGGTSHSTNAIGGYGGYAVGEIDLEHGKNLYINVGGAGTVTSLGPTSAKNGGYNGGGNILGHTDQNIYAVTGGGATHIAFVTGLLKELEKKQEEIIIVAGGGGGSGYNIAAGSTPGSGTKLPAYSHSGSGGGYKGGDSLIFHSNWSNTDTQAFGGTQEKGGTYYYSEGSLGTAAEKSDGTFGQGGSYSSGGAGGGFFGGGSVGHANGGGSGYIGNSQLKNKEMYCYNCEKSDENDTKTTSTTSVNTNPVSKNAKIGNGYAKITYLGSE